MKSKTRPIKSNRHKSVTSTIDCPEISFQREERHGVMRLAFFENNDITPETWKDFDFNTLSTLMLNRNIYQDLQQQQHQQQQQQQQQQQREQSNTSPESETFTNHSSQFLCDDEPNRGKTFPSLRKLRHPKVVHVEQQQQHQHQQQQQQSDTFSESKTFTNHSGQFLCDDDEPTRGKTFPSLRKLRPPRVVHSEQEHEQQQQLNTSSESKTFMNHSGQFLCDEPDCGKTFPSLRKLRHHKVVHSDEFPFICQFKGCGKRFKRKFGIDLHSTTHFDLDPDMYEKTSNNSSLTFFGRRMQYSMCKPCNQKFKTVHDYQDHMLGHGKEPFKCLVEGCGQTFSIWKSFQKHRASHYFNYFCKMDPQCGHSTSNLQLLKLHIYCCHFRRTLPDIATVSWGHDDSQEEDEGTEEEMEDQQVDDQDTEEEHNEVKDDLSL